MVFLPGAEPALVVEHFAQLLGRVEVEVVAPCDLAKLGLQYLHLVGEPLAERSQFIDVDADTDVFHLRQHQHERVLDAAVELDHPLGVHARDDRLGERVDRERVASSDLGVAE